MRNTPTEIWINCSLFHKEVPLGLCTEVAEVANGALKPQLVPELWGVMQLNNWSVEDVRRLHKGCK